MRRTLLLAGAVTFFGTFADHAEAAPSKTAQTASCQPRKESQIKADGTAKALHVAAEGGNAEAMNALAIMYAQGLGVARSVCMAKKLFEQSAAEGYAPAMVNLGMMHATGDNLRRDGGKAYAWIRAALYVGIADEERDATVFKLGMIAGRLDVSQVDRAEALARQIARSAVLRRAPAVDQVREPPDAKSRT